MLLPSHDAMIIYGSFIFFPSASKLISHRRSKAEPISGTSPHMRKTQLIGHQTLPSIL